MKAVLTSSAAYFKKDENGRRQPAPLFSYNGLVDNLKKYWADDAKVLIIAASADEYRKNDDVCDCMRKACEMSGLGVSNMETCDGRTLELADRIGEMDVVILAGGHVPTQNAFFRQIGLKEKLASFTGLVLAWSAGSMNCAEMVYAAPELDGEALDPEFKRWIPGLGLTGINIFPHYDRIKDDVLDGLRVIEDITYADSMGHEIIALSDGAYIVVDDGRQTLYGEAFRILDGKLEQICEHGRSIEL